jgi:glycosyltransferase involved in cell wall biosynthesis
MGIMKIIVDCQAALHHCVNPYSAKFVLSCHEYLLQNKSAVEWLFITDKKYLDQESISRIPAKNILFKKKLLPGWKFWYDSELPSLAKKHAADLLINLGGVACSTPIAQCTWIPDMAENGGSKKNRTYFAFYKKRLAKTLDCSRVIFTCCEKKRQELIGQYGVSSKKVMLVRGPADQRYQVLSWAEKENMRVKYAAGKEYYFARVDFPENSLLNLLKAFSQFKKRQQSNIQFVLAGKGLKASSGFTQKLKTFKYRSEVHIYETLEEKDLIKLTSAAYGLVHPFDDDETGAIVTSAFRANVAVIASGKSSLGAIAADAALYASLGDLELLASQMMLLYKDENLRLELIQKGNLISQQFDRDTSMEELQSAILQASNKQS